MTNTARFARIATVLGLIGFSALMIAFEMLRPALTGNPIDNLDTLHTHQTTATAGYLSFTMAQLCFIAGILGLAQLLRTSTPRLATFIAVLGVVGVFGHAVFGGFSMVMMGMAADPANHGAHSAVLQSVQSGPTALFSLMGLLGLIPTVLLLSIALFRSHTGPRWVPFALIAFVAMQAALSGAVAWAGPLSSVIAGAAFLAMALHAWRSPLAFWAAPEVGTQASPQTV